MSERRGAAGTSEPGVTEDSSGIIQVTVKTLKQKENFDVAQSSTIQEFKEEVAKCFKTTPDLVVLVFAGKVLKDQDTLSQHGIHNGMSIHVVLRAPERPQDSLADQGREATPMQPPSHSDASLLHLGSAADLPTPCSNYDKLSELLVSNQDIVAQIMETLLSTTLSSGLDLNTTSNSFLLGFLLGVTSVHLLGLDSVKVLDLRSSHQEQDMSLDSLRSKVVESITGSVDLITPNPQIQQLAEENPEIHQILTNPDTIREMVEAFSSPAAMQEMIRNRDVAMNNLESIPGGYSALEQLYREVEEPILDAVKAQMGNDIFASLDSNPALSRVRLPAHTENCMPLPNPWAPRSDGASDGHRGDADDQLARGSPGEAFAPRSWFSAAGTALPDTGEFQIVVQQLAEIAELMHNLVSVLTNPDGPAQTVLNSADLSSHAHSPPQDEQAQQLPPETEGSELSFLLRNSRVQKALLQIQLGVRTLITEVSRFSPSSASSFMEMDLENMDHLAESDGGEAEDQMVMEAPETRFKKQMEQLSAMGFQDQSANLQALVDAEGDVNAAAKILARSPSSKEIP